MRYNRKKQKNREIQWNKGLVGFTASLPDMTFYHTILIENSGLCETNESLSLAHFPEAGTSEVERKAMPRDK